MSLPSVANTCRARPQGQLLRGLQSSDAPQTGNVSLGSYNLYIKPWADRQRLEALPMRAIPTVFDLHHHVDTAHSDLLDRVARILHGAHLPFRPTLDIMKDQDVIISGSAALHALLACSWTVDDLDFYCGAGRVVPLLNFLQQNGYVVSEPVRRDRVSRSRGYSTLPTIARIYRFRHAQHNTRIDVIESCSASCVAPLLHFHSTIVMNWIAHDGIVCLYPDLTRENHGLKNTVSSDNGGSIRRALQKYLRRGFAILDRLNVEGYNRDSPRSLDDGHSFTMAFEVGGRVGPHRYQVRWLLSRMANRREVSKYPRTTGIVGWVEADARRFYQDAPNPSFAYFEDSD
ncbi:hypothetical protein BKA70DRAFT_1450891 [Coprinopsis sp. MPI-PUGE-AT-0042]|nr:hypothetical protein BKA70DRAFT_1450891 [Coprinopsis sp. MPI-PUGE-AT-0042]